MPRQSKKKARVALCDTPSTFVEQCVAGHAEVIIWRVWEGAGFCCTTCRHTADDGTDEPALLSMNLELPESGAEMQEMQEMQDMF